MKKITRTIIFALLISLQTLAAEDVRVIWDANPPQDEVSNYTVYGSRTPLTETNKVSAALKVNSERRPMAVLEDIPAGRWFLGVDAQNELGFSSNISEILEIIKPQNVKVLPVSFSQGGIIVNWALNSQEDEVFSYKIYGSRELISEDNKGLSEIKVEIKEEGINLGTSGDRSNALLGMAEMEGLGSGDWYFMVQALGKSGIVSDASNVVQASVLRPRQPTGLFIRISVE